MVDVPASSVRSVVALEIRQPQAAQQFDRAGHLGRYPAWCKGRRSWRAVGTRIQHLAVSAEDERLLLGQSSMAVCSTRLPRFTGSVMGRNIPWAESARQRPR